MYSCVYYELRGVVKTIEGNGVVEDGRAGVVLLGLTVTRKYLCCAYASSLEYPYRVRCIGGRREWNIFPYNMYLGISLVTAVKWRSGEVFVDQIKYCESECECRWRPEDRLYNIRVDFIKRILPTNIFRFVWRQKVLKKAYTQNRSATDTVSGLHDYY